MMSIMDGIFQQIQWIFQNMLEILAINDGYYR